jgi:hypothetical protein
MKRRRGAVVHLVAVCFAAAITSPDDLVIHRHAGGDHLHVHAWWVHEDAHEHDRDDHDHLDHDHEAPGVPTLAVAGAGWAWHAHWKDSFQRCAAPARACLAPLRAVARITIATPGERIAASLIPARSRAPPPLRRS